MEADEARMYQEIDQMGEKREKKSNIYILERLDTRSKIKRKGYMKTGNWGREERGKGNVAEIWKENTKER